MGEHQLPKKAQVRSIKQAQVTMEGRLILTITDMGIMADPKNEMPDGKLYNILGMITVSATSAGGVQHLIKKIGEFFEEKQVEAMKAIEEAAAQGDPESQKMLETARQQSEANGSAAIIMPTMEQIELLRRRKG